MINYIALIVALCISCVSGFYSIYGLTAIFSSAFYPIILMGAVLEAGKLTTASWLYNNWDIASRPLKYYLTIMVILLMLITSMGTFGFLSRAHIEQTVSINTGNADQVEIINQKINEETQTIDDINKQIKQIDDAISKMTDKGQALSSLKAADKQRKTRDQLIQKKTEHNNSISSLNEEKIKLQSNIKKLEAEVGPIKYIAQLLYGSDGYDVTEKAVRYVIILLVIVFDPLAVVLLIAANFGLSRQKKSLPLTETRGILKIPSNVLDKHP